MATARNKPASSSKVTLRFDAQPHHEFTFESKTVNGGSTFTVDEKTAKNLVATFPEIRVDGPAWPESDGELDALAVQLAVDLPAVPYGGGEPTPTAADKIAALEAAGFTPATALAAAESTKKQEA